MLANESEPGLGRLETLRRDLVLAPRQGELTGSDRQLRQRHLVDYFLGRGYEQIQNFADARSAYQRVLMQVPNHHPAWQRLERLSQNQPVATRASRPAALTPAVACDVEFGGFVTLLGYTVTHEPPPGLQEPVWTLVCHWLIQQPTVPPYSLRMRVETERGDTVLFDEIVPFGDGKDGYPTQLGRSGEVVIQHVPLGRPLAGLVRVQLGLASQFKDLPTRLDADPVTFPIPLAAPGP